MGDCPVVHEMEISGLKYDEADLRERFEAMGSMHLRLCTRTEVLRDLGDREAYLQTLIQQAHALVDAPVLERIMIRHA